MLMGHWSSTNALESDSLNFARKNVSNVFPCEGMEEVALASQASGFSIPPIQKVIFST